MAPSDLAGKWKHERSENFESYLVKVEMPEERRQMALKNDPEVEVVIDGNHVALSAGNWKQDFTIGTPFQQRLPGGQALESEAVFDGNKLVIRAKDKNATTTREVIDGKMVAVMDYEGVSCTRYFKRC